MKQSQREEGGVGDVGLTGCRCRKVRIRSQSSKEAMCLAKSSLYCLLRADGTGDCAASFALLSAGVGRMSQRHRGDCGWGRRGRTNEKPRGEECWRNSESWSGGWSRGLP